MYDDILEVGASSIARINHQSFAHVELKYSFVAAIVVVSLAKNEGDELDSIKMMLTCPMTFSFLRTSYMSFNSPTRAERSSYGID